MAKARGIPPLGRTPNALPAPQAPAYLPMAKARGITQDLVSSHLEKDVLTKSTDLEISGSLPQVLLLNPKLLFS
jgi:hypothetical protein